MNIEEGIGTICNQALIQSKLTGINLLNNSSQLELQSQPEAAKEVIKKAIKSIMLELSKIPIPSDLFRH